jgi:hypothetical protein
MLLRPFLLLPFLFAVCGVSRYGDERLLVYEGSPWNGRYVVAWAVALLYLAWFVAASGRLVLRRTGDPSLQQWVTSFFTGAAALMLFGVLLGLAGLLYSWIVMPVILLVLFFDRPSMRWPKLNYIDAALLATFALVCAAVFLHHGVLIDLLSDDVQQLYAPYLREVARNHSIWIADDNPIFSDFEIGHGNGLHLLLASIFPAQVGQMISVLYFAAAAGPLYLVAQRVQPQPSSVIAGALVLLGLSVPAGFGLAEFGKYHLQASVFLVFLLWIVLQTKLPLVCYILPGLALGLSYPMYGLYAGLIAALGVVRSLSEKEGVAGPMALGVAASVGICGSLLSNQLYLGIASTNPYSVFAPFANMERFSRFASADVMQYLTWRQSLGPAELFDGARLVRALWQAASMIVLALACAVVLVLWPGSTPAQRNASAFAIVAAYVVLTGLITSVCPHLGRLDPHIWALVPLALVGGIQWCAALFKKGTPSVLSLALAVASLVAAVMWPVSAARHAPIDGFLRGDALLSPPDTDRRISRRCIELQAATGNERILPVNAWRAMVPCYFSPVLSRGKIVHTYESDVARDLRLNTLSDAGTAEQNYRRLGVNLFYIQKGNCDVWLNGFGPLFSRDEMRQRLGMHSEAASHWLLTWRTDGKALGDETLDSIQKLIERSRSIYREAYEIAPFERFTNDRLPQRPPRFSGLERLLTCD